MSFRVLFSDRCLINSKYCKGDIMSFRVFSQTDV